jgi:hypothetical protein
VAGLTASIGKHPERSGVWCVFVPCQKCKGTGRIGGNTGFHYDVETECDVCRVWMDVTPPFRDPDKKRFFGWVGTGKRILSTHSTRDGAVVSANQINRAEAGL